jgi:hypothetical protein
LREEKFDYHVPMLSMLRYIGIEKTTQIDPTPYLVAPRGANLPHFMSGQYKVGIVWASGDHGPVLNERRRLAPLVEFLGLTEIKNTVVVSLQKGKEGDDLRRFGLEGIIYDLAPKLKDFADTAAAILKMDVVISVDSAVAHLAGALGLASCYHPIQSVGGGGGIRLVCRGIAVCKSSTRSRMAVGPRRSMKPFGSCDCYTWA